MLKPCFGSILLNTISYTYGNPNWSDRLNKYNNHTITYDALGNPLSYYNGSSYTFTWKDGRRLATLTKGNTSVSYKYNSDGIRYEKTVNGVKHKYYLMGSTITAETIIDGTNITYIEYFYDSYGPYGFSIDGTFYYYVKNLQGDVTQIRDINNGLIASYVYDAWGKVLSITENTTNNIGAKNAIRYRGYYYDTESNLYYLNARYYDPQIKRFLNPDGILGANGDIIGYNMYAYCSNKPIKYIDSTGFAICTRTHEEAFASFAVAAGSAAFGAALGYILYKGFKLLYDATTAILNPGISYTQKKEKEKAEEKEKDIPIPIPPEQQNYSYWEPIIIDDIIIKGKPLTYSEARDRVALEQDLLCRDQGAAYAVVKFYPHIICEEKHRKGYLNHYHINNNHNNHIWFYGEITWSQDIR